MLNVFVQIANLNGKKGSGTGDVENYWDLWWMVAGDYRRLLEDITTAGPAPICSNMQISRLLVFTDQWRPMNILQCKYKYRNKDVLFWGWFEWTPSYLSFNYGSCVLKDKHKGCHLSNKPLLKSKDWFITKVRISALTLILTD